MITVDQVVRDIILVGVWTLVVCTIIQAVAHGVGYVVLNNQRDRTDFGRVVRNRELWLALKNAARSMFNVIVLIAVTWGISFDDNWALPAVLIFVIITSWGAAYFAVRFVLTLHQENWGRPTIEILEFTNIRQDNREVEQNVREVHQDERKVMQDASQVLLDEDRAKIDYDIEHVNVRQDEREIEQNVREVHQDERKVVQDALQVVLEENNVTLDAEVTATIAHTAEDVEIVKEDVKDIQTRLSEENT